MFKNNTVWITGGSSGIGEALALQFAAQGARLVLSSRRKEELERVRDACVLAGLPENDVLVLPLDVTDWDSMPAAASRVCDVFGNIDMLINNAGISQRSLCVDTDMAVYRRVMEVDVLGQIALTKAVLPTMLKQSGGHIVITSSVAGKIGTAMRTGYCAAKHAVMGFFDSLRAEMDQHGIRVTTVTPGYIRTNISVNAVTGDGEELGKMSDEIAQGMDVDKCAAVILEGLRKGTPEIAVGDGPEMKALWLKRFFPRLVFKEVAKLAREERMS